MFLETLFVVQLIIPLINKINARSIVMLDTTLLMVFAIVNLTNINSRMS